MAAAPALDPITTEIIRSAFIAAADEMNATLIRSAYTPVIYEMKDCSVALLDDQHRVLGQSAGLPIFLGNLEICTRLTESTYGREVWRPGDVWIMNDSYLTGTHLNDMTTFGPIFAGDELIGFAACRAHWLDVGAKDPGGPMDSTEIYQEGIRIPPLRIVEGGVQRPDVTDLLGRNSRFSYPAIGDLGAQIACIRTGAVRLSAIVENQVDALTTTHHDLYAIRLDGVDVWKTINYGASVGYNHDADRGCREMASVKVSDTNWLSVLGKDGCDKGRFDAGMQKGGDLVELQVGASADAAGVKWVNNSGATELTGPLLDGEGKLVRLFGAYDAQRKRVVFGQGTFDNDVDTASQDRVYAATKAGTQWRITELHPGGQAPVARYGTCAAYVNDLDNDLDGLLVVGGQQGGTADTTTYNEVWWLDFSKKAAGEWRDVTARFTNEADFGPRREGACAYDPTSRMFYSWMGRSSKEIPGGAKHSSGAWRVDLTALGSDAPLTWERLAKDDLKGVRGRTLIPPFDHPDILLGQGILEPVQAHLVLERPAVLGE